MDNYSYNFYPESAGSSPRGREIEFENPPALEDSQGNQDHKVKFMCSYGGKIHPRPHDNQLTYVGGETKILAVDRNIKFVSLFAKLITLCDCESISFKYQLPGEDLDALISVTNDDDLEHMMHEYERLYRNTPKPARLRIFVFPTLSQSLSSSTRSFGSDDAKSEKERFVDALNTAATITAPPRTASPAAQHPQPVASNVGLLFGLEKTTAMAAAQPMVGRVPEVDDPIYAPVPDERSIALDPIQKHIQDLQRLRLEEQQAIYRRKSDDSLIGTFTAGEYDKVPEKTYSPVIPGGVPHWPEGQIQGGPFPASSVNNEQPIYMIQTPASAYHAPMVRQMAVAPAHGYYMAQRMPSEQQMYNTNMMPQKAAGYPEGFGMVRPGTGGSIGVVAQAGYAQVAYDAGTGRQVIYAAPGGAMGAATLYGAGDTRTAGSFNHEGKGLSFN